MVTSLSAAAESIEGTYDRLAHTYDDQWSRHVLEPHRRLTADLALRRGERAVDFACGTGVATLDMARRTAPGEMVAVDSSSGMLNVAVERARAEGVSLTPIC